MVDKELREIRVHGDSYFPIDEYDVRIPHHTFLNEEGLLMECHWHKEWEFFAICEGRASFSVNGEHFLLNQNDVVLVPSNSIHVAHMLDHAPCRYQSVVFSMDIFGSDSSDDIVVTKYINPLCNSQINATLFAASNNTCISDNCYNREIYTLFHKLLLILRNKPPFYEISTKAVLYELLACTLQSINIYNEPSEEERNNYSTKGLILSMEYMTGNLQYDIQVPKLAKIANMSVGHYGKSFKEMTSYTPIEYLTILRLDRATQLLLDTDYKISNIAMDVGFNNISYFNRSFKKRYGISPKQYRDRDFK